MSQYAVRTFRVPAALAAAFEKVTAGHSELGFTMVCSAAVGSYSTHGFPPDELPYPAGGPVAKVRLVLFPRRAAEIRRAWWRKKARLSGNQVVAISLHRALQAIGGAR